MAVDMFLKIDGIDGESQDAFHKGEIEILSFSWGASSPRDAASGQATGRRQHMSLNFTKITDSASPQLFDKWCGGNVIKNAVLSARHPIVANTTDALNVGGAAASADFLKITLTEVLISSLMEGANGQTDANPMEQVSLNFAKIQIDALAPDGNFVQSSCSSFQKV